MKYFSIALSILLLTACSGLEQSESKLAVHALKVGKADSFLISYNNEYVLIDTGEEDDGEKIVAYLQQRGITHLHSLIITHFDKDHVGGADHIVEAVTIGDIYVPVYESTSKQTEQFLQAIENRDYELTRVTMNMKFSLENMKAEIEPPSTMYAGDNNNSLIIHISYGETSFLFTGDIEQERIADVLAKGIGNYTFLKVPHHGRFNDETVNFIQAVRPEIALITSSNKNPEASETVQALEEVQSSIYTTRTGDVIFSSDGIEIRVNK